MASRMTSIDGVVLDTGEQSMLNVRAREVLGRNGWAVKD
jgi:hypothetical protein